MKTRYKIHLISPGRSRLKQLRKYKLPRVKGYRTSLTFGLAAVFFAISYVVTVDRVIVAALFVVIMAILMLVDTRLQRSRQEASTTDSPPGDYRPAQPKQDGVASKATAAPTAVAPERIRPPQAPTRHESNAVATLESPASRQENADAKLRVEGSEDTSFVQYASRTISNEVASPAPSQALHHNDWLQIMKTDYLDDFIKNGGSGVKFVIPQDASDSSIISELRREAENDGYFFASIDAAITRAHMVDDLFHEIARQVDWDGLAGDFLRTTLRACQYLVPQDSQHAGLAEIAEANGLDLAEMRAIINNRLRERLAPYSEITDNFRRAMLRLCQAHLDPRDLGAGGSEAVHEWLRGDLRFLSAVKSAAIFEKIDRSNGRDMVSSLSHWLHLCGKSGLILHLDISRFLVDQREGQPDGSLYYNTASVLDGYEVLRQFVDGIDQLQYCLIVVSAPPEFLTDEKRGVRRYDALYLRVWDEVHLGDAVNPFSALVQVSRQAAPRPMREKQPVS